MPGFLAAGGENGALIGAQDWASGPLGPPEGWPSAVKSALATWLDSPQPMFMAWGPDLRFFFNNAYLPFLGARRDGAMGRPFKELWSDVWPEIEPIVNKALQGHGSRFEEMPFTLTRNGYPEQTWFTFTYVPLRDEQGTVIGLLCTTSDVTAQVLAARQKTLERERQRLLLQQMPGFVGMLSGPDHVYEYVNDAYRRIAGFREFIGLSLREVFPEVADQGLFEVADRVYATGEPFIAHALPVRLAGEDEARYVDLLCHPIRNDDGTVSGIFIGGHEVTERVKAEAALRLLNETLEQRVEERTAELVRAQGALRQAQKLEAVGQLTGGVAHDFNNLLTIIGSSVELMRRKNLPEDRRRHYMDAISETVRRASKLTGQLLAFARRQPLSPVIFDVGQQLGTVIELIRPLVGARVQIDLATCDPACFAEADINQFETAVVNLAVNSRDAMNGEGRLRIDLKPVDALPPIRNHARRPGAYVAVSVTDSGSGIDPDKLDVIFEPFYTTKGVGKGTGLGLSQVFGFAQQSGGDVEVRSTPGQGATFTLYLPRVAVPPAPGSTGGSAEEVQQEGRGTRVLVVEDNETVGQFSTEMLHDLGYQTTWATDATKALALLAQDSLRFDLVFSDVIMPGMNGVELARAVRDRYPGLPVVLTSGYSHVFAEEGRHGFVLIQKPYSIEALSRVIRQAIAQRAAAG
ncbi:MAG: PAS domain S-box protein [Variovorax sp.]